MSGGCGLHEGHGDLYNTSFLVFGVVSNSDYRHLAEALNNLFYGGE